jgi:hypothetical protein
MGFETAFGGQDWYTYCAHNPIEGRASHKAMTATSTACDQAVASAYDFSRQARGRGRSTAGFALRTYARVRARMRSCSLSRGPSFQLTMHRPRATAHQPAITASALRSPAIIHSSSRSSSALAKARCTSPAPPCPAPPRHPAYHARHRSDAARPCARGVHMPAPPCKHAAAPATVRAPCAWFVAPAAATRAGTSACWTWAAVRASW